MAGFNLPRYYVSLALNYHELTLYDEAEAIATRALELQPTLSMARNARAIARVKNGHLEGALADLNILFGDKKFTNVEAQKLRDELLKVVKLSGSSKKALSRPSPFCGAAELTQDDHRPWTSVAPGRTNFQRTSPCWHHNNKTCAHEDCPYSHTPDPNSIRDTKGQNVCLKFLLGCCTRPICSFKHSMSDLPDDVTTKPSKDSKLTVRAQWWNDITRVNEVQELLRARPLRRKQEYEERAKARREKAGKSTAASAPTRPEKSAVQEESGPVANVAEGEDAHLTAKTQNGGGRFENKQLYTSKGKPETTNEKKMSSSKKTSFTALSKKTGLTGPDLSQRRKEKAKQRDKANSAKRHYPMSGTLKSLEKFANCGFTDDDVEDLMEFGVNPWDENALSVFGHFDDSDSD